MEAQAEAVSAVDAQSVDDPPSERFTWTIENFSRLNTKQLYSETFLVEGYKWRIFIFPKGNSVDHLSMYLDVADSPTLPYGWSRYAEFSLAVMNQIHNKYTIRKVTQHQFNADESDWGFTSFMPLGELYDRGRGYLVNDTCIVEADVTVPKIVDIGTDVETHTSTDAQNTVLITQPPLRAKIQPAVQSNTKAETQTVMMETQPSLVVETLQSSLGAEIQPEVAANENNSEVPANENNAEVQLEVPASEDNTEASVGESVVVEEGQYNENTERQVTDDGVVGTEMNESEVQVQKTLRPQVEGKSLATAANLLLDPVSSASIDIGAEVSCSGEERGEADVQDSGSDDDVVVTGEVVATGARAAQSFVADANAMRALTSFTKVVSRTGESLSTPVVHLGNNALRTPEMTEPLQNRAITPGASPGGNALLALGAVETSTSQPTSTFKGVTVDIAFIPILQEIWAVHGDIGSGLPATSERWLTTVYESLAQIVQILLSRSGRNISAADVAILSDVTALERMGLNVTWLVPCVERAKGIFRTKEPIAEMKRLMDLRAAIELRLSNILQELKAVQGRLSAEASALGEMDFDIPLGGSLNLSGLSAPSSSV